MQKLKSGLTALAVGIVLLVALDWAASAATGNPTLLGKWNQAGDTTTIKNTGQGPALALKSKSGPALSVNSDSRVKDLNADEVDGLDAKDLQANRNKTYHWTVTDHDGDFTQAIAAQPPGSYLVSYSLQLSGAGGSEATPNIIDCRIVQSGVSGAITFTKQILAESQLASIGSPPALNGTSPLELSVGDTLELTCTMSVDKAWSTSTTQPVLVNLLKVDGSTTTIAPLGRRAVN
jgi:hypothetical protein